LRNKIAGFTTVRLDDENVFADDAGATERIVERRAEALGVWIFGFGKPVGSREGGGPRTRVWVWNLSTNDFVCFFTRHST